MDRCEMPCGFRCSRSIHQRFLSVSPGVLRGKVPLCHAQPSCRSGRAPGLTTGNQATKGRPMPRSRLGQKVAAMAARHRAAEALGIPVASVEAMDREELRAGLTRRGFLAGAASAVAGAVALDGLPAVSGRARAASAPRIVIVGAGIAGLSAALRLQDSGVACRIYEANTRIGGRMYSNTTTWAQGQVSEWGGELIDTGHKTIQTLARRFNIGLDDLVQAEPSSAQPTYFFGG